MYYVYVLKQVKNIYKELINREWELFCFQPLFCKNWKCYIVLYYCTHIACIALG